LSVILPAAVPAQGATIIVTTTADELNHNGQCSLREAIDNANTDDQSGSTDCAAGSGHDTITFQVSGTIVLGSRLTVGDVDGLTIEGPPAGITLSGNHATAVLSLHEGANALHNLTVADGSAAIGGGIQSGSTLTVSGCVFSGNASTLPGSGSGGGAIRSHG